MVRYVIINSVLIAKYYLGFVRPTARTCLSLTRYFIVLTDSKRRGTHHSIKGCMETSGAGLEAERWELWARAFIKEEKDKAGQTDL